MESRIAAGGALSIHWRTPAGDRLLAQLYIEDGGLRIEYGLGDRDGRWMQTIGMELAPWHMTPVHLGGFRRRLGCPAAGGVERYTMARRTHVQTPAHHWQ